MFLVAVSQQGLTADIVWKLSMSSRRTCCGQACGKIVQDPNTKKNPESGFVLISSYQFQSLCHKKWQKDAKGKPKLLALDARRSS